MYDDFKMMDEKQLQKALREYGGSKRDGVGVLVVSGEKEFEGLLNRAGEVYFAIQDKFSNMFEKEFILAFKGLNIGLADKFKECYGRVYIPNCRWKDIETMRELSKRYVSFLEELFIFAVKEDKKYLKTYFEEYLKMFKISLDFIVKC